MKKIAVGLLLTCAATTLFADTYQVSRQNSVTGPTASYSDANGVDQDQFTNEEDRKIGKRIRDKLKGGWFSKGYETVYFTVNNGNVTIRGTVEKDEDKTKVEKSIHDIEGVKVVNNQIIVSPRAGDRMNNEDKVGSANSRDRFSTDDDRAIGKKIRDKLQGGWFSKGYETVYFTVTNGNVTILGTVEKDDDRTKVEKSIRDIDGVKQVSNQIVVVPAPTTNKNEDLTSSSNLTTNDRYTTEEDRAIGKKIRDSFQGWFSKGYDNVTIIIDNGNVVLLGSVESLDDKNKIEKSVSQLKGVRNVKNQLTVPNDGKNLNTTISRSPANRY